MIIGLGLVAAACGGDGGAEAGSIERGLAQIPEGAYEVAEDGDFVEILIGDVVALSEVSRVDEPESGRDVDELTDWFFAMSQGVDRDRPEVTVWLPGQYNRAFTQPDSFDDVFGFDIGEMTGFVDIRSSNQFEFTVFEGDLEFDRELDIDVGDAGTLGDGDDGDIDIDLVSPVNIIGRTLGLAQRDGAAAVSTVHAATEAFVDDDETLADDDRYLAIAQVLDAQGAVGAFFLEDDFGDLPFASDELVAEYESAALIDEPFDLVGVGMAEVDGDPASVVAYLFDDDDDAASQLDAVEELWTAAELLFGAGERIDDRYDFVGIEQIGAVVVVTVTSSVDLDTSAVVELLFRSELQFFHT